MSDQHPDQEPAPLSSPEGRPGLGVGSVVVVYGVMGLLGWGGAWWLLDHTPFALPGEAEAWPAVWLTALLGAGVGLVVAVADVLLERVIPLLRRMTEAFRDLLGVMTPGRALAFATCSAVGEEILFRGFLLPWLGLVASSLIFGAMHMPPDRRLWMWPFLAVGMGFVFGWLYLYTGSLLAPVLAHFTINYFGFMRLYSMNQPEPPGLGSNKSNP